MLAAVGLLVALYISGTQLGLLPQIWDPIFGSASSYAVTHSALSRLLPIPDGVFGVLGYSCDLLFGSVGNDQRWRTAPWAVLLFALVITGLALVSLFLTIAQATFIHHWCSVCLLSACVSLVIFGLGIGEAIASLRYLSYQRAKGRSLLQTLLGRPKYP